MHQRARDVTHVFTFWDGIPRPDKQAFAKLFMESRQMQVSRHQSVTGCPLPTAPATQPTRVRRYRSKGICLHGLHADICTLCPHACSTWCACSTPHAGSRTRRSCRSLGSRTLSWCTRWPSPSRVRCMYQTLLRSADLLCAWIELRHHTLLYFCMHAQAARPSTKPISTTRPSHRVLRLRP
jgi:hypothetical protein